MSDQARSDTPGNLGDRLVVRGTDAPPVAERTEAPRKLIGMKGHCTIEGWHDADGNSRQFPCEILKMSPHMLKISTPVVGAVGNWVMASFEHLGKFEGPIIQVSSRVLVMKIFGTNEDRAKVAGKLAWMSDAEKSDGRRFPRMVPANPASTVSAPGGLAVPCEVVDYSASGAAVCADVHPEIGSLVKIGNILGRVVRRFGGGFAVSFLALQDLQSLEASILRPRSPASAEG